MTKKKNSNNNKTIKVDLGRTTVKPSTLLKPKTKKTKK
jgi:hypothetical protein